MHKMKEKTLYAQAYDKRVKGKYEESVSLFHKLLAQEPEHFIAWNAVGTAYKHLRKFDKAMMCYDRSLELSPNFESAQWNKNLLLLLLGKNGKLEYHWLQPGHRLSGVTKIREDYPQPIWDGEALEGTLMLQSQHGLGDVIQFIRYAGIAKTLCDKVIVETHVDLKSLFETCPYIDEVYAIGDEVPPFDAQMEIVYLPFMFDQVPQTPYLFPRDTPITEIVAIGDDYPKVGIVWQGNTNHPNDMNRSCNAHSFKKILDCAKVFSLQKGFKTRVPWFDVTTIGCIVKNMEETASAIKEMDLVISVDTSVAHLAAAMNKETWLLLPYLPDWRWGVNGSETKWYSSMTIFRQPSPGDWKSVFKDVEEKIIYQYQCGKK